MKSQLLSQFFHGTEQVIPTQTRSRLEETVPLRIKFGVDPSSPDIHLGHWVILKKLKILQDLGHHIIFLVGDFTATIGDPTGKSETRKPLSSAQIDLNVATYTQQVFKLLDPKKTEVVYNAQWLNALTGKEMVELASKSTVARMLERDDFQNRFQNAHSIGLHEFLYPLLQGYDSVFLKSDLEIGGTDQTFNLLMGRNLQKEYGQPPQAVVTVPILEGLDGVQKMSKSLNNHIPILDSPQDMYGKLMSIPDTLIVRYFSCLTDISADTIAQLATRMRDGENPKHIKQELAKKIVSDLHSNPAADEAALQFDRVFSKHEFPDEMPTLSVPNNPIRLDTWLVEASIFSSKKEVQRLALQQAITLNGQIISDSAFDISSVQDNPVLKIGKRKFFKIEKLQ